MNGARARRQPLTLTQRVVWALTGTVAVFVGVLALLSYLTFDEMEDALVNDILASESQRVMHQVEQGDPDYMVLGPVELGGTMRVWHARTPEDAEQLPEPLQRMAPGMHIYEEGVTVWHVAVVDVPPGRVMVVYDATDNEARVHEFGLIVLALGVICSMGAYLIALRVARLVVSPMQKLTGQLSNWAPGAPDMAVDRDDEVGRLIEAFNRMQGRVDQSIAREREFSANLSHEVRTPLAVMRTDAELLLDTALTEDARVRLQRTLKEVDSVVAALESARALAREEAGAREPTRLADSVDDAWSGHQGPALAAGLRLDNQVPPDQVLPLDRYALLMVLRNLVRNAIEHAAPATLTVTSVGDGLDISDDGPGIDPIDLPFIFDRYYSGVLRDVQGEGAADMPRGLGLAIAKRVCDTQGWTLAVSSRTTGPDRGTRFHLRFA